MSNEDGTSENAILQPYKYRLFRNWTYERLRDETRKFIENSGLQGFAVHVRRGAKLTEDPGVDLGEVEDLPSDESLHSHLQDGRVPVTMLEHHCLNLEKSKNRWDQLSKHPWQLYALVACCSLGAAVQGWDESVINGAQYGYIKDYNIATSTGYIGLINGAPYLCCFASCWLTGPLNLWVGRKGVIFLTCLISAASCFGQAFCSKWWHLLIARLILGVGIGPKSATIPIYAAESVPERVRGALVMQWQMWTAFGIMLGLITSVGLEHITADHHHLYWRLMLGSPMVLPSILCLLVFSLPESPRWYLQKAHSSRSPAQRHKYYRKAFNSLCALRHTDLQAARDLFMIDYLLVQEQSWEEGHNRIKGLVTIPRCSRAFFASLTTMFLQQFCGVNVLAYYSSIIFAGAQSKPGSGEYYRALKFSMGFGIINFVFALPAIWFIDIVGRRSLLLFTFPLMAAFQFSVAMSYFADNSHRQGLVISFAYLFAVAYSVGEGPVPFLYSAESMPLFNRDYGMGVITAINWGLNFLVAMTWPALSENAHDQGAFGFYAFWCAAGFFMILLFVPETKNYTLEELDEVFERSTVEHMRHGLRQLKVFFQRHIMREKFRKFPDFITRARDDELVEGEPCGFPLADQPRRGDA